MSHDRILIKGNEAVAFGALDAGCRCYFGYPITPQNEIPETMSLRPVSYTHLTLPTILLV